MTGIEEIRYQIESLGNYVKGLQLAAGLLRRLPTDRHLQSRMGKYLVQVLTHASTPYLPDPASFSLPPAIRAALRSVQPRSLETKTEIGAVLCLLVDKEGEGFVRIFRCKRDNPRRSSQFSLNISPILRDCILNACRQAEHYLDMQYHVPSLTGPETGYYYEIVGGPPSPVKEVIDGRSVEGAAALAFLSQRTQVALPTDIAISGQLDDLTFGAVSGIEKKVRAVVREQPYVARVFIPQKNLADLPSPLSQVEAVPDLHAIVEKVFKGHFVELIRRDEVDIRGILSAAERDYRQGEHRNALKKLQGLLRSLPISRGHAYNRFFCWWRIGSVTTHWGDITQADTAFAQALEMAETLWKEGRLSSEEYLNLYVSYAVHLTDLYRYKAAERALRDNTVSRSEHSHQAIVEVKRLGTLGQLYRYAGQLQEAEQTLQIALNLLSPEVKEEKEELPREHTYLGTLYTDMGKYDLAKEHFRKAEEINQSLGEPSPQNETFTRTYASRLFYFRGEYDRSRQEAERVIEISSERVFPACIARRYQGLSLIAMGQKEHGLQILREEMVPPLGAVDWPSPNIWAIRDVSVIELALYLLQEADSTLEDVRSLLRHVLTGLKNFSAAHHFFKSDITRLQHHLDAKKLTPPVLRKHLIALRDKIHT